MRLVDQQEARKMADDEAEQVRESNGTNTLHVVLDGTHLTNEFVIVFCHYSKDVVLGDVPK